jgi:hypothetical protein
MDTYTIGSLNVLGDAYNPFEFMENPEVNPLFENCYSKIKDSFESITSSQVLAEISAEDRAGVQEFRLAENFASNCTESFLERDNKMALINRTNLIVCATKALEDGQPLFRKAKEWRSLILLQREHYFASGKDIPILLWDIACCLAVERHFDEYESICSKSYLNPENLVGNFERLLSPMINQDRSILAVQEFPKEGSANRAAMLGVLDKAQMAWAEMGDVGFLYSKTIRSVTFSHSPFGIEPISIVDKVQQRLQGLPVLELVEDELSRFRTTARKTLVMDVESDLRIVAVHVKELKTEAGTVFLARYLRSLCDDSRMNIIVGDTNIASSAKANIFAVSADACGLRLLTSLGSVTTRKRRSELHGQRYDSAKCLKVVAAHKDFALAWCGSTAKDEIRKMWDCKEATLYPDLVRESWRLLPSADWPSDHCLVRVVLQPTSS